VIVKEQNKKNDVHIFKVISIIKLLNNFFTK